MNSILAISLALASFSAVSAIPGFGSLKSQSLDFSILANHAVYTADTVAEFNDIDSEEDCLKKLSDDTMPIVEEHKFDKESKLCEITRKNDFQVENLGAATDEGLCIQAAQEFFMDPKFEPFLDLDTWTKKTQSQFEAEYTEYENALEKCKDVTPGIDPIFQYDKRVKEIDSLKNKIFDRILALKSGQHLVWDYNMNDGIGFRIIFNSVLAPGLSEKFAKCLERELKADGYRSRDGMTVFMSGKYNVPSLNIYNKDNSKSVLEYQMWPLASGTWMLWQQDRYYKAPTGVKGERRDYVKSLQMAALCMDDPTFVINELPGITSKAALETWLTDNCNSFLKDKHNAGQAKAKAAAEAKGKPFKAKAYEAETENFDLTPPNLVPPIYPLDLIGIVWEQFQKTRASDEDVKETLGSAEQGGNE